MPFLLTVGFGARRIRMACLPDCLLAQLIDFSPSLCLAHAPSSQLKRLQGISDRDLLSLEKKDIRRTSVCVCVEVLEKREYRSSI